jgi:dGTPase
VAGGSGGSNQRFERFEAEVSKGVVSRGSPERDRDRILYSSAFRRLNGVTQVAAAGEVGLFHNRLTHSLKVAQTARKIGATLDHLGRKDESALRALQTFGGGGRPKGGDPKAPSVDPWVLETAGLGHDLGHPPFGHIGEKALQKAISDKRNVTDGPSGLSLEPRIADGFALDDGFEGNAQSFRILTRLSFGSFGEKTGLGLNLTRASLAAVSKYPWTRNEKLPGYDWNKNKWGAYDSEKELLDWCMQGVNKGRDRVGRTGAHEYRTFEAQAMDWADDVTYAVHDLEDFCRAGLIPIEELISAGKSQTVATFWRYCRPRLLKDPYMQREVEAQRLDLEACLDKARVTLVGAQGAAQPGRRGRELLRSWAVTRIDHWTGPEAIGIDSENGIVVVDDYSRIVVEILKNLTWFYVIDRPALASAQRGQSRVLRELFVWLVGWAMDAYKGPENGAPVFEKARRENYSMGGLPPRLVDFLDISYSLQSYRTTEKMTARAVVDYLSSLTEVQALDLHSRLGGSSRGPMLDAWFTV